MTKTDPATLASALSYADAGFTLMRLSGKVAIDKEWQKSEYTKTEDIPAFLDNCPGGNFGVVLGGNDLVVDLDPRNFPEDRNPFKEILSKINVAVDSLQSTAAIVNTGGGGRHLYFKLKKPLRIHKHLRDLPGIDFLTKGCYVVAAGSEHPDTHKQYELRNDCQPLALIQEAPPALLGLIAKAPERTAERPPPNEFSPMDDNEVIVDQYRGYLLSAEGAVEGDGGDGLTFFVAARGRDLGLSSSKTYEMMSEHYNPRCVPVWTEPELQTKVKNAYSYAEKKPGNCLPSQQFTAQEIDDKAKAHPMFAGWHFTKAGTRKVNVNNTTNFFLIPRGPLADSVGFDDFAGCVMVQKKVPWDKSARFPRQWTDEDTALFGWWLSNTHKYDVSIGMIEQSVISYAKSRSFHPLKDYLTKLTWDKRPRLETFLMDHAAAIRCPYVAATSKMFIMQAVNRALHPGCKADYVVVFESDQGRGKSQMLEVLGGEWYADIIINTHDKDTIDGMRGKWIIEMAEMEVTRRADAHALKAFVTRRSDRVRLAYGRRSLDLPRTSVFSGTINPEALNQYLMDSTGNRRFFPVEVGEIDLNAIARVRNQLFAEAVHRLVVNKELPYITDKEVLGQVAKEQASRQYHDPWEEIIWQYIISNKQPPAVSGKEIFGLALKGNEVHYGKPQQMRIATILKKLGYVSKIRDSHRVYYNQEFDRRRSEVISPRGVLR